MNCTATAAPVTIGQPTELVISSVDVTTPVTATDSQPVVSELQLQAELLTIVMNGTLMHHSQVLFIRQLQKQQVCRPGHIMSG